jgi:hypothetical protein
MLVHSLATPVIAAGTAPKFILGIVARVDEGFVLNKERRGKVNSSCQPEEQYETNNSYDANSPQSEIKPICKARTDAEDPSAFTISVKTA